LKKVIRRRSPRIQLRKGDRKLGVARKDPSRTCITENSRDLERKRSEEEWLNVGGEYYAQKVRQPIAERPSLLRSIRGVSV